MTNINSRCVNEEAKNVVNMGFSMINTIIAVRNRVNNTDLQMRIGIHTVNFLLFFVKNIFERGKF